MAGWTRTHIISAVVFALVAILTSHASAAPSTRNNVFDLECAQQGKKRVALLIGNNNYTNPGMVLSTAKNDARDLGEVLCRSGFQSVRVVEDGSLLDMVDGARWLADQIPGSELAVFYFSGHGTGIDGTNYMLPTDFLENMSKPKQRTTVGGSPLDFSLGIDINFVLEITRAPAEKTETARILVFDACRSRPPIPGLKGSAVFYAPRADEFSLVAFSQKYGADALQSNSGQYSRFTGELIDQLRRASEPRDLVATILDVRTRIVDATGGRFNATQRPDIRPEIPDDTYYIRMPSVGGPKPRLTVAQGAPETRLPDRISRPQISGDRSCGDPDRDYVFPNSDRQLITSADLREVCIFDVNVAINEIYARNGRRFVKDFWQDFFGRQRWYRGTIDPSDFNERTMLTEIERRNIDTLNQYDKEYRARYNLPPRGAALKSASGGGPIAPPPPPVPPPGPEYTRPSAGTDGLLFPDSDKRPLQQDEIAGLSYEEARRAINEMYARRGYRFKDQTIQRYFQQFSWYEADLSIPIGDQEGVKNKFNDFEKGNHTRLVRHRDSKR